MPFTKKNKLESCKESNENQKELLPHAKKSRTTKGYFQMGLLEILKTLVGNITHQALYPALFENIFKFCTFLPKFSNILPFFNNFFPFFWKITRMPLLSRIGSAHISFHEVFLRSQTELYKFKAKLNIKGRFTLSPCLTKWVPVGIRSIASMLSNSFGV